jgi:hypothetical protein
MIVACDPGLHGAFAMIDGEELQIWDMPTYVAKAGARKKDRTLFDEAGVLRLVAAFPLVGATRLVIEQVSGAPGQSSPAAFTFGYGVGFITACAMSQRLAIDHVAPSVWKLALRAPSDKRASRARASELLPAHAEKWPLAGHDGRAEAAMIALYAERCL